MNLQDLIDKQFGVKTFPKENPVISSVDATAKKVLDNNPNRVAWIIINLSANNIYVALSRDVSSSKGILLSPNGGFASMVWDEDFQMTGWEIWAIAPAGASAIYVLEVNIS